MQAKVRISKVQAEQILESVHLKSAHFFFWWCTSKCGKLPNRPFIIIMIVNMSKREPARDEDALWQACRVQGKLRLAPDGCMGTRL